MASDSSIAASSSSAKKTVVLISGDRQNFEVSEAAAMLSNTVKNMIEDVGCTEGGIPLPNVDSATLVKVLEYCNAHAAADGDLSKFDSDYTNSLKDGRVQKMLFDVIMAANYLEIVNLVDLTCQLVADIMKGKTPEEIRDIFHIKNDYTPEEEAEVRRENQWAFE